MDYKLIRTINEFDSLFETIECGFLASDKEWKYYVNDKTLADLGAEEI